MPANPNIDLKVFIHQHFFQFDSFQNSNACPAPSWTSSASKPRPEWLDFGGNVDVCYVFILLTSSLMSLMSLVLSMSFMLLLLILSPPLHPSSANSRCCSSSSPPQVTFCKYPKSHKTLFSILAFGHEQIFKTATWDLTQSHYGWVWRINCQFDCPQKKTFTGCGFL